MDTASSDPAGTPLPRRNEDELRQLFHQLNNELGIILSHAELLESKAPDEPNRKRAAQVVTSVLDALTTAREIRLRTVAPPR